MSRSILSFEALRCAACFLAALNLTCLVRLCRADEKPTLERKLLEQAPEIVNELASQGLRRVGVLKFRVETRPGVATDRCGDFNLRLAEQLEAALAIANPQEAQRQIQLVRGASQVAHAIQGASHLTPAGLEKLFSASYPLAWGNANVSVDAFVTGVVQLEPTQETIRVNILVVKPGADLKPLVRPFVIATDPTILSQIGSSFHIRGPMDDPAQSASAARERPQERFPLRDQPSVALKIYYGGRPVNLEFRDGGAWIPEPRIGEKVMLQLERLDRAAGALGAVLKVNGENTAHRQRLPDVDCWKWILKPGGKPTTIWGFQANQDKANEFQVVSLEESKEFHYGPELGLISLTVFRKASLPPPAVELTDEDADLLAISRAAFPDKPARSPEALQAQLRLNAADNRTKGVRGVIVAGQEVDQKIRLEDHQWDPQPVLSAVIRYYKPATQP